MFCIEISITPYRHVNLAYKTTCNELRIPFSIITIVLLYLFVYMEKKFQQDAVTTLAWMPSGIIEWMKIVGLIFELTRHQLDSKILNLSTICFSSRLKSTSQMLDTSVFPKHTWKHAEAVHPWETVTREDQNSIWHGWVHHRHTHMNTKCDRIQFSYS